MSLNNNFYDDLELRDREKREKVLFDNFSNKILKIIKQAEGWKETLKNINISEINSREDLKKIPITRKTNLTNIQSLGPPYGNLSIKDPNSFSYAFTSPGPINEPGDSGDFWNMSRCLFAAGLKKKELVYNTFSYHLGPAGIMMGNAANSLDCTVIAGGVGNSELQINTINSFKPSFYMGTPSFLRVLLEKALEKKINVDSLKRGLVGAEPYPPSLREYFKKNKMHIVQMYGTAEVGCIAYETTDIENNNIPGMIIEENIILEIIRPGTNISLPPGEVGEVVVTKLNSNYPMIRLATGDLSSLISEPSPCGRTNYRIKGWMGRAEQSTKVKGLFITPVQVNSVLKKFKEIIKVKLVITNENLTDEAVLICESKQLSEELETKVKNYFRENNKLNINVKIINIGKIANDGLVIEDKRVYD